MTGEWGIREFMSPEQRATRGIEPSSVARGATQTRPEGYCTCGHDRDAHRVGMKLTFQMLWPDPPLRSNKRLHHMAEHRIKRDIRQAGFVQGRRMTFRSDIICPLTMPVNICMVWSVPTRHRRDADSGQPTLKAWIDGIVSAGVLRDDNWQCVPRAWCEIEHCPGQPMSLRVEITPA